MKNCRIFLLTVVLFCFFVSVGIAQISWVGDYQTALKEAQSQRKLMFLYCYTPESVECQRVAADFFTNAQVSSFVNAYFIPMRVDVNKEREIATKFAVLRVPIVIILDPNGNELMRLSVFTEPNNFLSLLSGVLRMSFVEPRVTTITPTPAPTPTLALSPTPAPVETFIPIKQITTDKIGKIVQVKGKIVNAVSPTSQKAPYSYYISDGTESIRIVIWRDIFQRIKNPERFIVGSKVIAKGRVQEFRNRLEIHLLEPEDIRLASEQEQAQAKNTPEVTPVVSKSMPVVSEQEQAQAKNTPEVTPVVSKSMPEVTFANGNITLISSITRSMVNNVVTVRGEVTNIRPSWQPKAPNIITLRDQSQATINVVYWSDIAAQLRPDQQPRVNAIMEVTGIVNEYRGSLQIKVNDPSSIKVDQITAVVTPAGTILPISTITRDLIGQRVNIYGTITGTVSVKGGTLLKVTDQSGTITIYLRDTLIQQIPYRNKIVEGAKVKISGVVYLYEPRQELEIQLSAPEDIEIITP